MHHAESSITPTMNENQTRTLEEFEIRCRRFHTRLGYRKRIKREGAHTQRHTNKVFFSGVELRVFLMPDIIVVAQHT